MIKEQKIAYCIEALHAAIEFHARANNDHTNAKDLVKTAEIFYEFITGESEQAYSITEGYVVKGGVNPEVSQVKKRPGTPAAMRV